MTHASFSSQLLTDPYTALHDASAEAVAGAAAELRAAIEPVLFDLYPIANAGPAADPYADRKRLADAIADRLAPLVARYAHAITGVDTLRALLNGGKLEFNAEGTVVECRELIEKVTALGDADRWEPDDTNGFMLAAIDLGVSARELLARQMDAQNPMTKIAEDIAAGASGSVLATAGDVGSPAKAKTSHAAALVAIDATERALEAAQGADPAVTEVLVQLARVALEAAEAVLDDSDEAVAEAKAKLAGAIASEADRASKVEPTLHFTATRRDGEKHSATVPRSIGRGDLEAVIEAARSYDGHAWTIERTGDGDETVIGILDATGEYRSDTQADEIERRREADADVVAGDEAISAAVEASNERRAEAAEAFEAPRSSWSAERGGSQTPAYPTPFYEVYRADTGRQAPHCTTRTYDSALSYCRASYGTPWHILEIDDAGGAILVTDVKIDGTVVELTDRLPDPPAQPPEEMQEMVRDLAAKTADAEPAKPPSDEPEIWFTATRADDPGAGDFCKSAHYQVVLEYCQGSPGAPWRILQHIAGANIGGDPTPPIVVTTVDEAGDVTEVGERGTP